MIGGCLIRSPMTPATWRPCSRAPWRGRSAPWTSSSPSGAASSYQGQIAASGTFSSKRLPAPPSMDSRRMARCMGGRPEAISGCAMPWHRISPCRWLVRADYRQETRDGFGPGFGGFNSVGFQGEVRNLKITVGGGLDKEIDKATRIAAGIYYN